MKLIIRKAELKDINQMCGLLYQLFSIEEDFVFDEKKQSAGLEMMINNKDSVVLVACDGERVIGMVTMQKLISTAQGAEVGLIEDMIVTEEYRGMSSGSELLKSICRIAEGNGLKRIQLLADKNNISAKIFYKKNKWSETSLECMRYCCD